MGCDIHGWIEVKSVDKWIAISELHDTTRNYERFTKLANVRSRGNSTGLMPNGIPDDVSETTRYWIDFWNVDRMGC